MMIRIRQANRADTSELSELAIRTYTDTFRTGFSPSDLSAHLDKNLSVTCFQVILANDIVMVAENETRMVGYVQFGDARIRKLTAARTRRSLGCTWYEIARMWELGVRL